MAKKRDRKKPKAIKIGDFYQMTCSLCGCKYEALFPCSQYCDPCKKIKLKEVQSRSKVKYASFRKENKLEKIEDGERQRKTKAKPIMTDAQQRKIDDKVNRSYEVIQTQPRTLTGEEFKLIAAEYERRENDGVQLSLIHI